MGALSPSICLSLIPSFSDSHTDKQQCFQGGEDVWFCSQRKRAGEHGGSRESESSDKPSDQQKGGQRYRAPVPPTLQKGTHPVSIGFRPRASWTAKEPASMDFKLLGLWRFGLAAIGNGHTWLTKLTCRGPKGQKVGWPATPPPIWVPVQVLGALPPIQIPDNAPDNAEDGPGPLHHVGDPGGVIGSWPRPGLTTAVSAICGVERWKEDPHHHHQLCHSNKINFQKKMKRHTQVLQVQGSGQRRRQKAPRGPASSEVRCWPRVMTR